MKKIRLVVVGAVAVASLWVGAGPASACQPDRPCPPCGTNETWNTLLRKLGHPC